MSWTQSKPTEEGIYKVRGWRIGAPFMTAVVEVMKDESGHLVCNLHEANSDQDTEEWDRLAVFSDDFEWQGPFMLQPQLDVGGRGGDERVSDDSYIALLEACRSQIGPGRPWDDEPEDQWMWDKLTSLLKLIKEAP